MRLLMFTFAGSAVSSLRPVTECFSGQIKPMGFEYPGRGTRIKNKLVYRMDILLYDLYEFVVAQIVSSDEPYALFGHSMGGMVAYELARRIEKDERLPLKPSRLVVSSQKAPHKVTVDKIYTLSDDAFSQAVLRYGLASSSEVLADKNLREYFLPIMRADFQVIGEYPTFVQGKISKLSCPISAFWGECDRTILSSDILGWHETTNMECRTFNEPGGHFFIFGDSAGFARKIECELERC